MEVPMLKDHPACESALQQSVQSLDAVTDVRINPTARSLVVHYNPQAVSDTALNQQILSAIQLVQPAEVKTGSQQFVSSFEAEDLTAYEAAQFAAIQHWQQQEITGVTRLFGRGLNLLTSLLNFVIPSTVFEKIGTACEVATANWQQDWQDLKLLAEVEDYRLLRQGALNPCDALAHHVTNRALVETTAEGGITGLFDWFGEVVDDGLTIVLALRTIHRIGLCYGYAPETPKEQAFAWEIFNVSIAQSPTERRDALAALHDLRLQINPQQFEQETLQNSLEDDANAMLLDSVIERGIAELGEETAAGIVPVLGFFLSIWADRTMIQSVGTAAQREFQLRWLYDNHKLRLTEGSVPH